MTSSGTASTADRAGNSDALENLARVGLIAYGVVHLLIAWLALQLAWGGGGESADQSGALSTLAEQPFGRPLLWVLAPAWSRSRSGSWARCCGTAAGCGAPATPGRRPS